MSIERARDEAYFQRALNSAEIFNSLDGYYSEVNENIMWLEYIYEKCKSYQEKLQKINRLWFMHFILVHVSDFDICEDDDLIDLFYDITDCLEDCLNMIQHGVPIRESLSFWESGSHFAEDEEIQMLYHFLASEYNYCVKNYAAK